MLAQRGSVMNWDMFWGSLIFLLTSFAWLFGLYWIANQLKWPEWLRWILGLLLFSTGIAMVAGIYA